MTAVLIDPRALIDAYASIDVYLDEGDNSVVNVSVHHYKCRNPHFGGTVASEAFKDRLIAASKAHVLKDLPAQRLVDVFTGKGRIEDIATALCLVAKYDALDEARKYKLLDENVGTQDALQQVCDKYIGLDCNGFVGNWANVNGITRFGPQTAPPGIAHLYHKKRSSLSDLAPMDVIVWSSHVAVLADTSDPGPSGDSMTAWVAESFGEMMYRPLTIRATHAAGRFSVLKHGGSAVIFPIGLSA